MRLSNKSTFSLACLVLLFAFATAPVMADSMSAVWSADVNTEAGADFINPGWNVTLTLVAAPGEDSEPGIGDPTNARLRIDFPLLVTLLVQQKCLLLVYNLLRVTNC